MVAGHVQAAKPFNVRLPGWAADYLERRSLELGTTKTQLMVDAISCLRAAQIQALMTEGYGEMNEFDAALVGEGMAAGAECLPEW